MDDYIRNQLDKLIFEENITQEELAEKVGVSRQTVYKWESGKSKPSTSNILKICEVFNKPVSYFIKGEENNLTFNNEKIPVVNNKLKDSSLIIDEKVEKNSEINNKINFRTNNKKEKDIDNLDSKRTNNDDLLKIKLLKLVKIFILSLILLILLFYLVSSIYKFIILSKLVSKLDKYKNLDNYYCHYINYSNEDCIVDEEIWYCENLYKIKFNVNKMLENGSLINNEYINLENKEIIYLDKDNNAIFKEDIYDLKPYKNGNLIYNLIIENEKSLKDILRSSLKIGKIKTFFNNELKVKYLNYTIVFDENDFIKCIIYDKDNYEYINFFNLEINSVTKEEIKNK